MRSSVVFAALLAPLALAGCGDDTTSDSDSETESSTGAATTSSTSIGTSTTDDSTTGDPTTTGDATTTGDGTTTTDGTTDGTTTTDGTGSSGSTGTTTGAVSGCGNGVLDGDELCDDGNIYDNDGCSSDCMVANCLVPVSHATIQVGIDDIMCSTVWVMPGTYTENVTIDRFVIVEGIPISDVTVDGGGNRVFDIDAPNVVLRNLTITGGMATHGAGIRASGSLTLERTRVRQNTATGAGAGGAGVSTDGMVTLLESSIDDNTLTGGPTSIRQGGGLELLGGVALVTAGSTINDNTISMSGADDLGALGGGIYAVNATLIVDGGSSVDGNSIDLMATGGTGTIGAGAGIVMINTEFTGINASFSSNTIDIAVAGGGDGRGHGAGIIASGSLVFLGGGTVVDGNTITVTGGGAFARGGGVYLEDNALLETDGGTRISANTLTSTGTNRAESSGGGVYQFFNSELLLQRTTVADNIVTADTGGVATALASGGGVAYDQETGGSRTIRQSTISGNQVTGNDDSIGGGLHIRNDGSGTVAVDIANSTISGNVSDAVQSSHGGGISLQSFGPAATFALYNSTVIGNTADSGGGTFFEGGGGTEQGFLIHSILYENMATTGPNCAPALTANFENVVGVVNDCTIDTTLAILMDPMAGTLGDNGGPTQTHDIDNTSPAYNAGQVTCTGPAASTLTLDQRGLPRAGACTIGSYEPQP